MTKDEMRKQAMHVLINSDAIWSAITYPLNREERAAMNIAIEALEDGIWTPVSEGPPEDDGTYLVSYCYDDFGEKRQGVSIATYGNQGKWYFSGHWWNNDNNNGRPIKAWMAMPEQYKEENK